MTPDKKISARQQPAAITALLLLAASVISLGIVAVHDFPIGLAVLGGFAIALPAAWFGARRRGATRLSGFVAAAAALIVGFGAQVAEGNLLIDAAIIVTFGLAVVFGGRALRFHKRLPPATPPQHPVLFMNPWSGDGKARKFALAGEAKKRGIDSVELKKGDDLETLVRDAVAAGADGLAMAGGDGSQAIVAAIAAELDLPYACIPAGTRNHLALDLGVNRDDVVGALDAFVDGGERRVDLAELNGRVFVNNVALGVYAEAVQRKEYRGAKLRTLLDTIPDALGDEGKSVSLRWTGPDGETRDAGAAVILVSNNSYRLGRAISSGTRPRLDAGVLGIAAFDTTHTPPKAIEWAATSFEVGADEPVPAGIDGEAAMIDPPLRFGIRPGALRARIAHGHPGVSPSAELPDGFGEILVLVCKIAAGRD